MKLSWRKPVATWGIIFFHAFIGSSYIVLWHHHHHKHACVQILSLICVKDTFLLYGLCECQQRTKADQQGVLTGFRDSFWDKLLHRLSRTCAVHVDFTHAHANACTCPLAYSSSLHRSWRSRFLVGKSHACLFCATWFNSAYRNLILDWCSVVPYS